MKIKRLLAEMANSALRPLGAELIGRQDVRRLDKLFLAVDQPIIRSTWNLRLVPCYDDRRGGKASYGEWCHVIGIFQTLLCQMVSARSDRQILDIGCGTGLLAIAAEPFVDQGGCYVGIEVSRPDVEFCRSHYREPHFEFVHLDARNNAYSPQQDNRQMPLPFEDASMDVVTALSVWTHLNEDDAVFYMGEVARVLNPEGRALITFRVLDEQYESTVDQRTEQRGRYHNTPQNQWVYDVPCSPSGDWQNPRWAGVPEDGMGVTQAGLERLTDCSGLRIIEQHAGNWKEHAGLYFQDIVVLGRAE